MEDVFKCHLYIDKILNRAWIESSLSCCLFVYIDFLFVCFHIFIYIHMTMAVSMAVRPLNLYIQSLGISWVYLLPIVIV